VKKITFYTSFNTVFSEGIDLVGWFEFLNNEDINLNKVKTEWEESMKKNNNKKRATLFKKSQLTGVLQSGEQARLALSEEKVKTAFRSIQEQLKMCSELIRSEKEA
jgi:DNA-binding CsgD family transcriptional regulator